MRGEMSMCNKVLLDNTGKPNMMVRIPKFKLSDVIPGAADVTHPAFIVDGAEIDEIYVSQYQNAIIDGKAYSLPFQRPGVNVTFDTARELCAAKGPGWHLMTNAEWAAIALLSKKNNTLPRGNNHWGCDYSRQGEKGVVFDDCKILTGSGPAAWSHDHTPYGIFDLNGNVWEWVSGLRLLDGEIQIIEGNNAAKPLDLSLASNEWKPILLGDKSLKYALTDSGMKLTTEASGEDWGGSKFTDLETDIQVPDIVKALALFPADDAKFTDYFWADCEGELLPFRGGDWSYAAYAGVFSLSLSGARTDSSIDFGFRSAYIPV